MNKTTKMQARLLSGLFLTVVLLSACYSSSRIENDPDVKGIWTMQNHASVKYISLVDDGSMLLQKANDSIYIGNYQANNGRLLIKEQPGNQDWLEFRYTIRNDSLLLDNGLKHFVLKRRKL